MPKQKIEFDPTCFGTIDKDEKETCNSCNYSDECAEFKEPLADKISSAAENSLSNYFSKKADAKSTAIGKTLAYGLALGILIFVFWQIGNDI